jgi:nucleotide-binding universal stress UspA family protein
MFKRILFSTDGSNNACHALEYVISLARQFNAEVVVIHAYDPVPVLIGTPYYYQMLQPRMFLGDDYIHQAVAMLDAEGIFNQHELMQGPATCAIVNAAITYNCDLIVMGAHEERHIQEYLIESEINEIFQNARCPVLVVDE